jgi:hypothetical protein
MVLMMRRVVCVWFPRRSGKALIGGVTIENDNNYPELAMSANWKQKKATEWIAFLMEIQFVVNASQLLIFRRIISWMNFTAMGASRHPIPDRVTGSRRNLSLPMSGGLGDVEGVLDPEAGRAVAVVWNDPMRGAEGEATALER